MVHRKEFISIFYVFQVDIGDDFFTNVMTMFTHFRRSIYEFIHQVQIFITLVPKTHIVLQMKKILDIQSNLCTMTGCPQ